MKKECAYDDVISKAISGKSLIDCISELEMDEQEKTNNSNIRTKERLEQSIVTILSIALVIIEILGRAEKKLPSTEALNSLVELGKLSNIKLIEDLKNRFSVDDKPTSVNYYELLEVDQNETTLAGKIAKKAAILHAYFAKIVTQYQSIPKLPEGSKIVKHSQTKPKQKISSENSSDDIKSIKDRLKYLRKKLIKVPLKEITEAPTSLLNDLEMITNIDKTLAINFERAAKHLELVAQHMESDDKDKVYHEFVRIRMDSGIPISETLQKIIKLHGWA